MHLSIHASVAATRAATQPPRVARRRIVYHTWGLALATLAALAALTTPVARAEECPNPAFRTGPSTHLPDCRAYELVSPPFKDAGIPRLGAIGLQGSSVMLYVSGAFAGLEGYPNIVFPFPGATYNTVRTASGWISAPDDLPTSEYMPYLKDGFFNGGGHGGENAEGGEATVWMARGAWQPGNELDFFTRLPDRSIADIGPALPPTTLPGSPVEVGSHANLNPLGLSPDGSHYFFSIYANYWPSDRTETGLPSIYEYRGTGNTTPLLVGVDNEGKQIGHCGVVLGGSESNVFQQGGSGQYAISGDGNTIFFTALPSGNTCKEGPTVPELYAQIDSGLPGAHTVAISEPTKEDCSTCDTEASVHAYGHFEGASKDGSKVIFSTTQPLLGGDTSGNLYEYDFDAPAGEKLIRISKGDTTVANPSAATVQFPGSRDTPAMISADGSHVYFLASGALTTTPNAEGESAVPGAYNLYVFEHDAQFPNGRLAFIAQLSQRDGGSWSPDVTPDGRFLVFVSGRDLTPDDTSTTGQVFEYDAQTGALVRISVGQAGFNHNGNVAEAKFFTNGEPINAASLAAPPGVFSAPAFVSTAATSVSDDGSYVFFQSIVGLTPQAFDQQLLGQTELGEPIYANNIYEYHDGRVSLISDGQDVAMLGRTNTVQLLGTDASGGDVFFTTVDRLVGQDTDTNIDVYDARIDGGFPGPALPPSCSGDACQGSLSAPPTLLFPGSASQAGGNPPLVGETAKPKKKAKKKRSQKGRRFGNRHAKRRGKKVGKTAVNRHANRKAGGS